MTTAIESGRVCAVAGQGQREMRAWAAAYPDLYAADAFDPALYSTLALAAAFSGPWYDSSDLRIANRACLWCFGLDWLIDYAATTEEEVTTLVADCRTVASGSTPPPGTGARAQLLAFLADLRDELSGHASFKALADVWLTELDLVLHAMAREWRWKSSGHHPTFTDYLDNSDNLGFSFVLVSHWIASAPPEAIAQVKVATHAVQRVIRLLNDLGTYERDLKWGDLNALLLDVSRDDVQSRITDLTREACMLLDDLADVQPRLATYMRRQMEFCTGFYGVTDYWGAP